MRSRPFTMSSRPGSAEAVFNRALRIASGERERFLASECAGNQTLRAEVESLLKAHAAAGNFLVTRTQTERPGHGRNAHESDFPTIAGFRIQRKLGEGSLGVVYAADDTKLQRPVAVKVLSEERERGA
jgi:serine/threonine protein kinase